MGFFSRSDKKIVVPIVVSDTIPVSMHKVLETAINNYIKVADGSMLIESDNVYTSFAEPFTVKRSGYVLFVQTLIGKIKAKILYKLIKHDLKYKVSTFSSFLKKLSMKVYRSFFKGKAKYAKVEVKHIWHNDNSIVVLDSADIDKLRGEIEGFTDLTSDLIVKLQNNGWGTIAIYDREIGLQTYFKSNDGLVTIIRL